VFMSRFVFRVSSFGVHISVAKSPLEFSLKSFSKSSPVLFESLPKIPFHPS